jgi:hypothetical protein
VSGIEEAWRAELARATSAGRPVSAMGSKVPSQPQSLHDFAGSGAPAPHATQCHAFFAEPVKTAPALVARLCQRRLVRVNARLAADVSDVPDSVLAGDAEGWFDDVVSAVSSVVTAPVTAVTAVARGDLKGAAGALLSPAKAAAQLAKTLGPVWDIAATGASFIPGVGTAVSAGMAGAAALGRGESLRDVALSAARGAVPGGPLGQAAFDVAVGMAKGGKRLDKVALDAARATVPGGALGKLAFDRGLRVVQSAARGNLRGAGRALTDRDVLGEAIRAATGRTGGFIGGLLPPAVESVARGMLRNPAMRAMPVAAVARKFGVDTNVVRHALASVVQAARTGARVLAPAPQLARAVAPTVSVDRAIARIAGRAAGAAMGPSLRGGPRLRLRSVNRAGLAFLFTMAPGLRKLSAARLRNITLAGSPTETAGLDVSGAKYTVEKGDYPAFIAKKLTGDATRWKALIAANPQKKVDPKTGNFAMLYAGEILNVPASWQKTAPGGTSGAGLPEADLRETKALLLTWGKSDGAKQSGVSDYGARPEDTSGRTWGDRDGFMWTSFATWRNKTAGTKALSDPRPWRASMLAELRRWNAGRATAAPPPKTPPVGYSDLPVDTPPAAKPPATPPKGTPSTLPQGITQAQALLSAWAHAYPKSTVYPKFGDDPADFSGTWDTRTKMLCAAFQVWFNSTGNGLFAVPGYGAGLRLPGTAGALDQPTYDALFAFAKWRADRMGAKTPPTGAPPGAGPPPPGAGPPAGAPPAGAPPKTDGGAGLGLLAMLAAAAAFL